jgi:hypothetical protein
MVSGSRRAHRLEKPKEIEDGPVEIAAPAKPAARHAVQASPDAPASVAQLLHMQAAGGNAMVLRMLQSGGEVTGADVLAGQIQGRLGSGEHLPEDVRERFAPGLGDPLSNVRVHRDAAAADLADAVGARAFTTGADVFFGAGQYAPDTLDGAHLIAHELVHTTQAATADHEGLSVSHPADSAEMAAEAGARQLTSGGHVPATSREGMTLHRSPAGPAAVPAPVVDISWIDSLPGHIQEQIDMFKQAALDKATGAQQQKLQDQRQHHRETFVVNMAQYLGGQAQVRSHFQAIHPIDVGSGNELWVHDSTRERLLAVKADLEAKNVPMPSTTVGLGLRGRHLHAGTGAGMMTHGLGFACDWKAYAAPHIKDSRLHTLFETVTGGPTSFHLEVGGKTLGAEARRDLIEQMGQGTADPEQARQMLESVTSEYNRLKQASADFKNSLPESSLSQLRGVERKRTEMNQAANRLKKAPRRDKVAAQAAFAEAQRAFEVAKAEVQANLATIFEPWLNELALRGEEIEKVAADKGVDLRTEVTTAETLKGMGKEVVALGKDVQKLEKAARKLLDGVRATHQSLLHETAGIETHLPDDSPQKAALLATAQQLLAESDGLSGSLGDLLPDAKPAKFSPGRGRKKTVDVWQLALDKARDKLGLQRTEFAEIDAPLQEARTERQETADDLAARKESNTNVTSKVSKQGLAQLQADRKKLFWLDQTAKALSSDIDFVMKSREVADPAITQLLGLMSGTEGGGFFTPDPEQGGEREAAQGKWSGTHGYNLEFFKAMVSHGFELGVAWDGSADTMHFELVEGRRLATSAGSRAMIAGAHSH